MIELWDRDPKDPKEDGQFVRAFGSESEARRFIARMASEMCLPRNKRGQFVSPYTISNS